MVSGMLLRYQHQVNEIPHYIKQIVALVLDLANLIWVLLWVRAVNLMVHAQKQ
jgi:hypothetical protein